MQKISKLAVFEQRGGQTYYKRRGRITNGLFNKQKGLLQRLIRERYYRERVIREKNYKRGLLELKDLIRGLKRGLLERKFFREECC